MVLTSGFSADWVDSRNGRERATTFLQKPYSARSLVDLLLEAISRDGTETPDGAPGPTPRTERFDPSGSR